MTTLETERLLLSPLAPEHSDFVFELVNEPSFKRFVGDKDVHSLEDARRYLREGPIGNFERYRENGYASESAACVVKYGLEVLKLERIIAMADPENEPSVRILRKLGFVYEREARMPGEDHDINLYSIDKNRRG